MISMISWDLKMSFRWDKGHEETLANRNLVRSSNVLQAVDNAATPRWQRVGKRQMCFSRCWSGTKHFLRTLTTVSSIYESIVTLWLFNIAKITICLKGKPSCSPSISIRAIHTMALYGSGASFASLTWFSPLQRWPKIPSSPPGDGCRTIKWGPIR
jgi:hypothetical protein